MGNYYQTLKVTPRASAAEIKSAYRRLARKLHPDKNDGSEETARAFAAIAEAYEVLGNPKERAVYDRKLETAIHSSPTNGDSVFASQNTHARRWRQMIYEHRYNEIIDRMIAEERRESMALQKIIFPIVALFVSTLVVAIFKPQVFENSAIIGKIIVISLFIAGVIHLIGRLREALERFTYNEDEIHESILDDGEKKRKPMSKLFAGTCLVGGLVASFLLGLVIGQSTDFLSITTPTVFSHNLKPEFVLYPPIFVLIVDLVHTVAAQFDI
jgi:curved DNA-binding protein CbpA